MKKITISYENGGMIFVLGEDEYYMAEAEARLLFGNHIAHNFRESFDEWNRDVNFIARFQVALEHFFNDADKVAKFLKLDVMKLRRWIGQGGEQKLETTRQGGLDEFPALKKRLKEELFPESEIKEPEPFYPNLKQISKITKMVIDGLGPREIAKQLGVDYSEYSAWVLTRQGNKMIEIERNKIINKRDQETAKQRELNSQ